MTLVPLRAEPLPLRVQSALRDAIFAGRYGPGAPLRELTLARELGTSQSVVREALLALEHLGLVERQANRGTRVVNLTGQDVRERVEVRLLLEERACVAAAARLDRAGWAALHDRLRRLAREARSQDHHGAAQADLDLHRTIWRASGNAVLAQALEGVALPLFAFISVLRARAGRMDDLLAMHETLLDAVASGRRDRIRASLRTHVVPAYKPFLSSGQDDLGALLRAAG